MIYLIKILTVSFIEFQIHNLNLYFIIFYTFLVRWTLIQRCLAALEECTKRISRHYKSYYRLANFYFRSPFHKDYKKFKDIMFGEQGLFVEKKPNNFFHVSWWFVNIFFWTIIIKFGLKGIWRIQGAEIDRSGSFAYHMSRCIHLLLDFLKETGDHKMLLDLAINLKWTPDVDKYELTQKNVFKYIYF